MLQTATTINIPRCRARFILRGDRKPVIWAQTYHASATGCASAKKTVSSRRGEYLIDAIVKKVK
jgi:hypothetical protein